MTENCRKSCRLCHKLNTNDEPQQDDSNVNTDEDEEEEEEEEEEDERNDDRTGRKESKTINRHLGQLEKLEDIKGVIRSVNLQQGLSEV